MHIVNCSIDLGFAIYSVISTVMVTSESKYDDVGAMTIAGSCAKKANQANQAVKHFYKYSDAFHIRIVGKMIEANKS